jgi:hypothetical protein
MEDRPSFFDFAAEVGLTKHIGGVAATDSWLSCVTSGRARLFWM